MPRLSSEAAAKYDHIPTKGCHVCSSISNSNVYHPRTLAEGVRGVRIQMCQSCYVSYKRLKLEDKPLVIMLKILKERPRRVRGLNASSKTDGYPDIGVDVFRDLETGEIIFVEDTKSNHQIPVSDMYKFEEIKSELILLRNEDLQKACQKNFTDQRFINKVVSSFSS